MKVTLFSKKGTSDKVYQLAIEEAGGGLFNVAAANGRRGSTLTRRMKTTKPVSYEDAVLVFNGIVAEKKSGSSAYTEGEDSTPYVGTEAADRFTGILPQLLTEATEEEAEAMIVSEDWGMQEKFDGKRIILDVAAGRVRGINRKGLECGIPETVASGAAALAVQLGDFRLDGEAMGDSFPAFDLLTIEGRDLTGDSTLTRHSTLRVAAAAFGSLPACFRIAPLWTGREEKRENFERIRSEGKEGVVFKRLAAPYTPGRPNSGGDQRKVKFTQTHSFFVRAVNQKRSFAVAAFIGGEWKDVGNVTVPANKAIPQVGDIVDVRYLYYFPGGSIYQPFFIGVRDDIEMADVEAQAPLKPKPKDEE